MASTMDPGVLGDRCCQKGDYLGAIEYYSAALKTCSSRLIPDFLNKRTAVFIKLQKYQRALPDAKDIIKRRPDLAMGYLRCGQILQLLGMPDKAFNILELGLSKVKVGVDGDRKKLSEHYEALRNKKKSSKRIDPLTKFPKEIVEKIFDNLDIKFCVRCLAVSKGWKNFLEMYPALWQDLEVYDMSIVALKAWLKRSEKANHGLRSASITATHFNTKHLNQLKLIQRCPKLASLRLDSMAVPIGDKIYDIFPVGSYVRLRTLVLDGMSHLNLSTVKKLLARLPVLEHVEFHDVVTERTGQEGILWPEMPSLRFILLSGGSKPISPTSRGSLNMRELIKTSPNVQSATISELESDRGEFVDFSEWKDLTYLNINTSSFELIPKFPATLKHLNVCYVRYSDFESFDSQCKALPEDYFSLPDLEYLSVHASYFVSILNEMANPSLISGSLKTLHIGDMSFSGRISFVGLDFPAPFDTWHGTIPAPSMQLEVLSLQNSYELSEREILAMLRQYPNLKRIDLSRTRVTGSTVRELLERENKPLFINLEYCDECHHDAVEAARNAGIEVNYRLYRK